MLKDRCYKNRSQNCQMLKSAFEAVGRVTDLDANVDATQRLRTRKVWRSSLTIATTPSYKFKHIYAKKFNMEPTVPRRNGALADRISAPNFYSLCTPRVATKLPDGFLNFCAVAGRGRFFPKRGTPSYFRNFRNRMGGESQIFRVRVKLFRCNFL